MWANTLSMATCPLTSLCGRRGNSNSKHYHISCWTGCPPGNTTMEYFSRVWRHMNQKSCYVIYMMDQLGDTSQETLQCIRLCGLNCTSLHYSRMLTPMPAIVWYVKGVLALIGTQQPTITHCSGRNFSIMGLGYYQGNFPALMKATLLQTISHGGQR